MRYVHTFAEPGQKVRLDDLTTKPDKHLKKDEAKARFAELDKELFELQELMFGAKKHSVLMVLQGRDTAGKDGAIKYVVGALNPRGVNVVSYGVPTPEEREHDFLWRIHARTPRLGEFAIFNRSHYEDVVVVRVHDLVPKKLWKERYDHINKFEELLSEHNTIVLKFFLHISKSEQEQRLLEREADPTKAWKLNPGDWKERRFWKDYTEVYDDAISRCSTSYAPWHVVPADAKWYRNYAVAKVVCEALKARKDEWIAALEEQGKAGRAAVEAFHKGEKKRKS